MDTLYLLVTQDNLVRGGGEASHTSIASIPNFSHKHRVAARCKPVVLPSRTPMSLLLNAYYREMQLNVCE